ncbi:hypothetical protein [Lewinella sp. IMCC34191]|uniref:hypothetical protein n=1 Tax=Lewinella sp. IMCC34191 TaxID=2259172 RepID=UPI001300377F|nr:hypothetical protein [Lewinella sp. IMCC34191]
MNFLQSCVRGVPDRENYDWSALRQRADSIAQQATTPKETYPALRDVLERVIRHSFLVDPDGTDNWKSGGDGSTDPDGIRDIPQATGRVISPQVSYVAVPAVACGHGPTLRYFADSL